MNGRIYIEIPVEEKTIELLDNIMKNEGLENHSNTVDWLIGNYLIKKAKGKLK